MEKTKVVLWGGMGAFLFSTFLGLIGRVSFFLLLLRALGGGVFFAALLWGAFWIIEKFIPELLQPQDATMEHNGEIDLVIPPHNPHDGAVSEGDIAPSEPAKEFDDFVEEVEETAVPLAEPTLEVNVGGNVAAPMEIGKENQQDGIDDLPDLGSFGDAFGDTSGGDSLGGGSPKAEKLSSHDSPGGEPAAIARAIQTVLKRDKKG